MTLNGQIPGYIYVLTSPNCSSVKIGRTEKIPPLRLREINTDKVYSPWGPWSIVDVVQVTDSVAVETRIHRSIRAQRNGEIQGQNELFDVSVSEARHLLRNLPKPSEISGYPKLERCFYDKGLAGYLDVLYASVGLSNFLNDQGAWTLSLFTSTGRGRYFTVNIGPHEVAFASRPRRGEVNHWNFLMVDRLIADFPEVAKWLRQRHGEISDARYVSSRDRATTITYWGNFHDALELIGLPGVRRSLIAYWTEGLLEMRETGRGSSYKNSHQWNAVAELQRRAEGVPTRYDMGSVLG